MQRHSKRLLAWTLAAVGLAAVLAGGLVAVPGLIRRAYAGTSLPVFNHIISGREVHPVDFYLDAWRRLFDSLLLTAVVVSGLLYSHRRKALDRLGGWLGTSPAWSPARVFEVSLCVGALAGIGESIQAVVRYLGKHQPSRFFRWEGVWMAPWSGALGFGLLAVAGLAVTFLLGRRRQGPLSAAGVAFTLSFIAVVGVAADSLSLYTYAVVLLAAGVGATVARSVRARPRAWERALRASRPLLAGGVAVATVIGALNLPEPLERRRVAGLAPPENGLPDVVLIILDTVRASSFGPNGYGRPTTPNLLRRAPEGIVFSDAIAPAPWTLPSHASMFTGRLPHQLSTGVDSQLDDTYPTLAEVFVEHGYRTAGFAANYYNTSEASGLARGFLRYDDFPVTWRWFLASSWLGRQLAERLPMGGGSGRLDRKTATLNTNDFLHWLEGLDRDRPFFAFLNYMDAHAPYRSPFRFHARFPSDEPVIQPEGAVGRSEEELDGTRAAYDAAIAYLDEEVERVLEALERSGRGDALVIVTADHGEFFGEHGQVEHGGALYEPVLHVPLLLFHRGLPHGVTIDGPASTRDLAATITEVVLGAPDPRLGGRSLAERWRAPAAAARRPVFSERQVDSLSWVVSTLQIRSLFSGSLHYVWSEDGTEELFDLATDPRETRDRSKAPDEVPTLRRLARLADSISSAGSPGAKTAVDPPPGPRRPTGGSDDPPSAP